MATIKQVADLAGVSIGTVSHVITGAVPVSESLRVKVQAAIHKLDYHPNHVARSLKTSRTHTLGIVVPDLTIPFYPQVIRGAEAAARQRKYSLITVNSDDDALRQKELLALLRSQRVEGILLIMASGPTPAQQIDRIREAGLPLVCLDRVPDRVQVDSVSVEDLGSAKMGVEHLLAQGYRRIAVVSGPLTLKNEQQRVLGYREALEAAGLPVLSELMWQGTLRPDEVTALCCQRLSSGVPQPDAIFATNGPTGLGVLRALRDLRLQTPQDIAFLTFDELTVDDVFRPSITTLVQPAREIGFRAAEILLERIKSGSTRGRSMMVRLPVELKLGDSTRLIRAAGR